MYTYTERHLWICEFFLFELWPLDKNLNWNRVETSRRKCPSFSITLWRGERYCSGFPRSHRGQFSWMGQDKASRADPKRIGRETTSTLVELYQPAPGRILGHHSNGMFARAWKLKMRFREFWLKVTLSHASTYADCKAMSCDMDGIQIRRLSDILERYQAPGISYVGIFQQVLPFSTAVVSKDLGKNWRQRSPR